MKTIFLSFSLVHSSVTDYFVTLANALSESGKVVVITDRVGDHPYKLENRIEVAQWPSGRPTKWRDFVFLYRLVKTHRPEISISMFGSVNVMLTVAFAARVKHRIAWARTVSTAFPSSALMRWRKRLVYKLATRIIANSEATREDLVKNFGLPSHRVFVFPNAVRRPDMPQTQPNPNKIVYVGRIHASKNVGVLIEALPEVVKYFPKLELELLGGDKNSFEIKALESRAAQLGVANHLRFKGSQPKEKVLEAFASSYFSVVPSLVEAFGFVVIESFSAGCPVIGSNRSGVAEIVRDGIDGFQFDPTSAQDLAQKMKTLLEDPALRERFSDQCYDNFLTRYELEKSVQSAANDLRGL